MSLATLFLIVLLVVAIVIASRLVAARPSPVSIGIVLTVVGVLALVIGYVTFAIALFLAALAVALLGGYSLNK